MHIQSARAVRFRHDGFAPLSRACASTAGSYPYHVRTSSHIDTCGRFDPWLGHTSMKSPFLHVLRTQACSLKPARLNDGKFSPSEYCPRSDHLREGRVGPQKCPMAYMPLAAGSIFQHRLQRLRPWHNQASPSLAHCDRRWVAN